MLKSAVWFLTMACNYKCEYCWEVQYQLQGKFKAHPIPPAEKWAEAFNRIKPSILDITGGEPFLMPRFVWFLEQLTPEIRIAITSNISRDFEEYVNSPAIKKVFSMTCSYHPSQELEAQGQTLEVFTQRVLRLMSAGIAHITVNFVAYPKQMHLIPELKNHFEGLGIRFHVDPFAMNVAGNPYTPEQAEFLRPFVGSDRMPDAREGENVMCDGGQQHLSIQSDGMAYRCILDKQLSFENYPGIKPVGNIFDENFSLNPGNTFCDQRYRCPGCDKDKVHVDRIEKQPA